MARTPSSVQLACAARTRKPPAAQHKLTSARKTICRRFKPGLYPLKMRQGQQALGILTYTKRCANAPQRYPEQTSRVRPGPPLMVNFHLVGNHRALVIAQRFDVDNGEIPVMQLGP